MTGKLKLNDRNWRRIMTTVTEVGRSRVKVGVLEDKPVEGGGGFDLVDIAKLHEFGDPASGVEERSYLRATLAAHEREIVAFEAKLVELMLAGRITEVRALDLLGGFVAGLVKKFIRSGQVRPELAESTIEAKGHSTVLVETSALVQNITHEVVTS